MIDPGLYDVVVITDAILIIAVMLKADRDYILAKEWWLYRFFRRVAFISTFCTALWMVYDQHEFNWPVPFSHFMSMISTGGLLLNNYLSLNKRNPPKRQTDYGVEQTSADGFAVSAMHSAEKWDEKTRREQ